MAASIHGTSGLTFGLTAETGGLIQNLEIQDKTEKAEVRNEQGEVSGVAFYGETLEISGEAVLTGNTGLGAIAPAASLTLASYTPAAGLIFVDEVTTKMTNTGFQTVSFKATVWPLITS